MALLNGMVVAKNVNRARSSFVYGDQNKQNPSSKKVDLQKYHSVCSSRLFGNQNGRNSQFQKRKRS